MFHCLLNLLSWTVYKGSPNYSVDDVPEAYERSAHNDNKPLLFPSGYRDKQQSCRKIWHVLFSIYVVIY